MSCFSDQIAEKKAEKKAEKAKTVLNNNQSQEMAKCQQNEKQNLALREKTLKISNK